jgi:uncharacterized alpha-E superfamily protein
MLSRTAESLYWTGRYVERAENLARVLDVTHRIALQKSNAKEANADWLSVLTILGNPPSFAQKYDEPSADSITFFATLDPDNGSSVYSCIRAARENTRSLRAAISNEMWESINMTWLSLRELNVDTLQRGGVIEFCDWVKERSHLFRGVSHGTTLHDDAFHFLRLGTFLERADNTARLLAAKLASASGAGPGEAATTYYEWGSVLRAVSAFRAYHQVFRNVITPMRVAELLIFNRSLPRSLRFCSEQVGTHLDHVAKNRDLDCQRLAGELHAKLRFARVSAVAEAGANDFLDEVIERLGALASQLSKDFMMTV